MCLAAAVQIVLGLAEAQLIPPHTTPHNIITAPSGLNNKVILSTFGEDAIIDRRVVERREKNALFMCSSLQ